MNKSNLLSGKIGTYLNEMEEVLILLRDATKSSLYTPSQMKELGVSERMINKVMSLASTLVVAEAGIFPNEDPDLDNVFFKGYEIKGDVIVHIYDNEKIEYVLSLIKQIRETEVESAIVPLYDVIRNHVVELTNQVSYADKHIAQQTVEAMFPILGEM